MPPQIVWPEMNAHHTAGLGDHFPCCLIAYRKNPLIGLNPLFPDVVLEPVGEFLWDEDEFVLPATLGVSEGQSSFSDIRGGKLQHLADPHSSSCHQLQYQPVSWL